MYRRLVALLGMLILTLMIVPGQIAGAGVPGPPLVLIHGYGGSPESTWGNAVTQLERAGYRAGRTLFTVRLSGAADTPLGLFQDAALVRAEIERIRQQVGADQVDLVGHSRGGLIVRILSAGETSGVVRRAVSIDAPHEGILTGESFEAMLREAGLPPLLRLFLPIPAHLEAGSPALKTLRARETRFADQRSPALAIGAQWQQGAPPALEGHDGVIPLTSQLGWPGAETRVFRLGPAPEMLAARHQPLDLARLSPHLESQGHPEVMQAVIDFLRAPAVKLPLPPCPCSGWPDLAEHWAGSVIGAYLPDKLPYTVAPDGTRRFEPDRPMTRAEFVYGLARMKGLAEQVRPTPFGDLAGHWALGYVEATREAGLVEGLSPDRFGPDQPLSRAEAAVLAARALGLSPPAGALRFADLVGHWAGGWVEAAAAHGIVRGDERGFRPDDPVTMAEGAVILIRAFGE